MKSALKRYGYIAAIVVTFLFGTGSIIAIVQLTSLQEEFSSRPIANGIWVISQGEVRLLRFHNALTKFQNSPSSENKKDVSLELDLLWSRFNLFKEGEISRFIQSYPGYEQLLREFDAFLLRADRLTEDPNLEVTDQILRELPRREAEIRDLIVYMVNERNIALGETVENIGQFSRRVGWAVIVAMVSGAIVVLLLFQRTRQVREEARIREVAETRARQALEEAEAASQAKSDFLANMSHELRTPLNAIQGFSQILASELYGSHSSPKYREYSEDIEKSGQHLLDIINDILDLARIESGKIYIENEEFDTLEAIKDCVSLIEHQKSGVQRKISKTVSRDAVTLNADKRIFKQTLINILSNSNKYTPKDGCIEVEADSDDAGRIRVRVRDTGVGIPATDLKQVVEPFFQARSNSRITHEGTGLGLALSKSLMQAQGGDLFIESTVGVGTVVTLLFPTTATVPAVFKNAPVT